jgi:hypothetical protein
MSAWIILGSGCFVVVLGALTLTGSRGIAANTRSPGDGWGRVAMGGGFVLDGGAELRWIQAAAGCGLRARGGS